MNFTPRTKPRLPTSTRPASRRQLAYLRSLVHRSEPGSLAAAKRHFGIAIPGYDGLNVSQAARLISYLLEGERS